MIKKLLLLLVITGFFLYGQEKAYITVNKESIDIGNQNIERVIYVNNEKALTTRIINKRSGFGYNVKSDEFALRVVFTSSSMFSIVICPLLWLMFFTIFTLMIII